MDSLDPWRKSFFILVVPASYLIPLPCNRFMQPFDVLFVNPRIRLV